jgi:Protein of unknown function (DUF1800)
MRKSTPLFALVAVSAVGCAAVHSARTPVSTKATTPDTVPSHDVGAARHALSRFAFGPTPGQSERVAKLGLNRWFEQQLEPPGTLDPELARALAPYRDGLVPPLELLDRFGDSDDEPFRQRVKNLDVRTVLGSIALAELVRHVESQRQVEEVMVDFWTNHFNVFARKGLVRLFAGDYLERALRPHALGRFHDLLLATAQHPAMLVYLDNARSVVSRAGTRRGLNENYARELLELHTLGIDGGYTQRDVTELARILTGWSVKRPREGAPEFVFRARAHDRGAKSVLGVEFPAGHGEEEGFALFAMLANHPSTARHLATKLCARFVADDPPGECVDAAARAYVASHGEIRAVLRAIFASPSFWSAAERRAKLKSPVELVASTLRALGGHPDGTLRLARALGALGEPLLLEPVPTGYPEAEREWLGASNLLTRMNFATAVASGALPGAQLELDPLLPLELGASELTTRAGELLLGADASPKTLDAVREELAGVDDASERRALAVALLVGSPEFQRQ